MMQGGKDVGGQDGSDLALLGTGARVMLGVKKKRSILVHGLGGV